MDELQVFSFDGASVRMVSVDGSPWFVGRDVCELLGYSNASKAITDHCKGGTKRYTLNTAGGDQDLIIINESNLYRLIIKSKMPSAERFESWVVGEVLPSIRKTGGYLSPKVDFSDPEVISRLLDNWREDRKKLVAAQNKIQHDAPKVEFFDQVVSSRDAIQMREVAAVLNIPDLGRNKLFALLRSKGILDANNVPYRRFQDAGYFRVIITQYADSFGDKHITSKTLVYPSGIDYIRKVVGGQDDE